MANVPTPAEVSDAIARVLEVSTRYAARQEGVNAYVPPAGANAELIAAEEAVVLPALVEAARKLEEKIPVRRVKGTNLSRQVLRAAWFARDLADVVRAGGDGAVDQAAVRDLMEVHEMQISPEAFAAMVADLAPERVRERRGPVEAALHAVSRVLGIEAEQTGEAESRGVTVLRNGQKALEDPEVRAALTNQPATD